MAGSFSVLTGLGEEAGRRQAQASPTFRGTPFLLRGFTAKPRPAPASGGPGSRGFGPGRPTPFAVRERAFREVSRSRAVRRVVALVIVKDFTAP